LRGTHFEAWEQNFRTYFQGSTEDQSHRSRGAIIGELRRLLHRMRHDADGNAIESTACIKLGIELQILLYFYLKHSRPVYLGYNMPAGMKNEPTYDVLNDRLIQESDDLQRASETCLEDPKIAA
jgi:hypothetical protein